jgi:hypothetical protein
MADHIEGNFQEKLSNLSEEGATTDSTTTSQTISSETSQTSTTMLLVEYADEFLRLCDTETSDTEKACSVETAVFFCLNGDDAARFTFAFNGGNEVGNNNNNNNNNNNSGINSYMCTDIRLYVICILVSLKCTYTCWYVCSKSLLFLSLFSLYFFFVTYLNVYVSYCLSRSLAQNLLLLFVSIIIII